MIAVKADQSSAAAVRSAIGELSAAAAASRVGYGAISVDTNASHSVARVTIPLPGNGVDTRSANALLKLRNQLLPQTIGNVPGAVYVVTGQTAGSYDWTQMMKSSLPIVFGFVLTFAFLLLLASFRSLVIAVKSVVLNLLSVAAAYGVVVAVFQYGWGQSLFGFQPQGAIVPWLPLMLFVILFGLSMDYHVFIVSRVREAHDRGMSTGDAVEHGIKTTAGTVTSAAVVMVGVFSIFATLPIVDSKEFGVGLAAAVLIDATIVPRRPAPRQHEAARRPQLVSTQLARWLPRLDHQTEPATKPATPPDQPNDPEATARTAQRSGAFSPGSYVTALA